MSPYANGHLSRMDAARAHQKRTAHALFTPAAQPTSSWWIGLSREELAKRARERLEDMQLSKFGRVSQGWQEAG